MSNVPIHLGVVLLAGIACGGDGAKPTNQTPVDDLPVGTAPPRPRTTEPRLPPGLSFEVEIPETADLSFAILVRVRDGDTVVPKRPRRRCDGGVRRATVQSNDLDVVWDPTEKRFAPTFRFAGATEIRIFLASGERIEQFRVADAVSFE
jgi:hypothetical protein